MAVEGVVFCEGKSDKTFLDCVARQMRIDNLRTISIGGGISSLGKVATEIRRRRDEGRRVALILDANSDPVDRRRSLADAVARLNLPVTDSFLLPNDRDPGCLENLLEQLAVENGRAIYDCVAGYEQCLRDSGSSYELPHVKGKVYAYCEALGIETRDWKRDYTDTQFWNLEAAGLAPLKRFLSSLAGRRWGQRPRGSCRGRPCERPRGAGSFL